MGWGGRHDERVELRQQRIGAAFEIGEAVDRFEGVGGREFLGLEDDVAHHRMNVGFVRAGKVANRRIAFGYPCAVVQQRSDVVEEREVERYAGRAARFKVGHGGLEGLRGEFIAEEFRLCWDRKTRRGRNAPLTRRDGRFAGEAVGQIECRGQVVHERGVVEGGREDRHAVERAARWHHACIAERATGGFESDDIVKACGDAPRAGSIRPKREGDDAARDDRGRPRTRATRDVLGVEAVGRDAVRGTHAHEAGCELIEIGFADDDGAGVGQPLHDRRAALWRIGERRAGRRGLEAGGVDVVLGGERHAIKRQLCQIAAGRGHAGVEARELRVEHRWRHSRYPCGVVFGRQSADQFVEQLGGRRTVPIRFLPIRNCPSAHLVFPLVYKFGEIVLKTHANRAGRVSRLFGAGPGAAWMPCPSRSPMHPSGAKRPIVGRQNRAGAVLQ